MKKMKNKIKAKEEKGFLHREVKKVIPWGNYLGSLGA